MPLDWGDQLVVRGDLAVGARGTDPPLNDITVQLHLIQPSRDVFALDEDRGLLLRDYGEEPLGLSSAAYPLRYDNRSSDVEPTLPGDYWVAVTVEPRGRGPRGVDVPVNLTFAVTPTDAAPRRTRARCWTRPAATGPDGYSPDPPYLVGDGEFSAVASGNPFTPEAATTTTTWWGPRRGGRSRRRCGQPGLLRRGRAVADPAPRCLKAPDTAVPE